MEVPIIIHSTKRTMHGTMVFISFIEIIHKDKGPALLVQDSTGCKGALETPFICKIKKENKHLLLAT